MIINSIHIEDYYILQNFDIDFSSNLSVLIGENGSGKSSVLECLAYIFGHLHKYFVLNDKTAEFISTCTYKGLESKMLSEFLDFVKENGVQFRTLMFNYTNEDVGAMILSDLLNDVYDKWPVFGDSQKNEYVYAYMIDGVKSMIYKWLKNDFNISSHDLAELIYNLCLNTAQTYPQYPAEGNHS